MRKYKSAYLVLFLALISALAGFSISLAKQVTDPIIEEHKLASEKANLVKIFPTGDFKQIDYKADNVLGVYEAKNLGYVFKVSAVGYNSSSPIVALVGVDLNNNVVAFYPLQQKETKGIGSRCFESNHIKEHYINKKITTNFDALAGASKTSAGIKKILNLVATTLEKVKG